MKSAKYFYYLICWILLNMTVSAQIPVDNDPGIHERRNKDYHAANDITDFPTANPYDGSFNGYYDVFIGEFGPERCRENPDSGLVAYWSFDEAFGDTAYDYSGNENHGQISGANWTAGVCGNALHFDGIDDYVGCGMTLTGNVLDAVTVVAWINISQYNSWDPSHIFYDGSDGEFTLGIDPTGHAEFWVKLSDAAWRSVSSISVLSVDEWFHVAGSYSYDNQSIKILINGEVENEVSIPDLSLFDPSFGDYYPTIAAYSDAGDGHSRFCAGIIDELRVYDRILIENEVQLLYQSCPFCYNFTGLFCDDFQDGVITEWQTLRNDGCEWTETNGVISTSNSGTEEWCIEAVGDQNWGNYIFEGLVRGNSGVDKVLVFRIQDEDNYYAVNLRSDYPSPGIDEVTFDIMLGGTYYADIQTAQFPSENGTWYYVKIECIENTFHVYIDDNLVMEQAFVVDPFLNGGIGVACWTGFHGSCDISFDNIRVTEIGNHIYIRDEDGNILSYAQVYHSRDDVFNYWEMADEEGRVTLTRPPLVGDTLYAFSVIGGGINAKPYIDLERYSNLDDMPHRFFFRLFLDNDSEDITHPTYQSEWGNEIILSHKIYKLSIVFGYKNDVPQENKAEYLTNIEEQFRRVDSVIVDMTNGQVCLDEIYLYDAIDEDDVTKLDFLWGDGGGSSPTTFTRNGDLMLPNYTYNPSQDQSFIYFPLGYDVERNDGFHNDFCHEFGHYFLNLGDEYCTDSGDYFNWCNYGSVNSRACTGNRGEDDYQITHACMMARNFISGPEITDLCHSGNHNDSECLRQNTLTGHGMDCWSFLNEVWPQIYGRVPNYISDPSREDGFLQFRQPDLSEDGNYEPGPFSHGYYVKIIDRLDANPSGRQKEDVGDDDHIPDYFAVSNCPNPFNAQTTINYALPAASHVTVEIYDILGRKIETIFSADKQAGYHKVIWDASHVSSGIYLYRIQAGGSIETGKMLLLK